MSDKATPDEQEKRPWMSSGPGGYYTFADRMPMDLFSYTREATHCLNGRRFLAAIVMASTAVELILNRDCRLRSATGFKKVGGWVTLNNHNLLIARTHGLAVEGLLSEGDAIDSEVPIAFVKMRNKVGHGEISEFITDLSDYDPIAAQVQPNPDVQEGHIRNRRWPELRKDAEKA